GRLAASSQKDCENNQNRHSSDVYQDLSESGELRVQLKVKGCKAGKSHRKGQSAMHKVAHADGGHSACHGQNCQDDKNGSHGVSLECGGRAKRRHRFRTSLSAFEWRNICPASKAPSTLRFAGALQTLREIRRGVFDANGVSFRITIDPLGNMASLEQQPG